MSHYWSKYQMQQAIRRKLESTGNKFASVEWIKKDGTPCKRTYRLNAGPLVGSARGQAMSESRNSSSPHCFPVYMQSGDNPQVWGWRTVDLNTVHAITIDGVRTEFFRLPAYVYDGVI